MTDPPGPNAPDGDGHDATPAPVPATAAWLGGLGVLPFATLSILSLIVAPDLRPAVIFALIGYGALILSFLGGVHWGLAVARFGTMTEPRSRNIRLGLSVAPSLTGWLCLLLPPVLGLGALTASFLAMLAVDLAAVQRCDAPVWYGRLRLPLTLVVAALLLLAFATLLAPGLTGR